MQEQGNARILVDLTVVQERPPGRVRAAYQLVGKISQNPPFFFGLHLPDLIFMISKRRKC